MQVVHLQQFWKAYLSLDSIQYTHHIGWQQHLSYELSPTAGVMQVVHLSRRTLLDTLSKVHVPMAINNFNHMELSACLCVMQVFHWRQPR